MRMEALELQVNEALGELSALAASSRQSCGGPGPCKPRGGSSKARFLLRAEKIVAKDGFSLCASRLRAGN